jgi:hypothetical protein
MTMHHADDADFHGRAGRGVASAVSVNNGKSKHQHKNQFHDVPPQPSSGTLNKPLPHRNQGKNCSANQTHFTCEWSCHAICEGKRPDPFLTPKMFFLVFLADLAV